MRQMQVLMNRFRSVTCEDPHALFFSKSKLKRQQRKQATKAVNILKACRWLTPKQVTYQTVESVTLDSRKLPAEVMREVMQLRARGWDERRAAVLCGPEEIGLAKSWAADTAPLHFSCDFYGGLNLGHRFYGVPWIVVPWMAGVLIVDLEWFRPFFK